MVENVTGTLDVSLITEPDKTRVKLATRNDAFVMTLDLSDAIRMAAQIQRIATVGRIVDQAEIPINIPGGL